MLPRTAAKTRSSRLPSQALYYRLNVVQIQVPPLRARGRDILTLLQHYLKQASDAHRLAFPENAASAEQVLLAYAWTGNVRELKNVAERPVLRETCQPITVDDLPMELRDVAGTLQPVASLSRPLGAQRVMPATPPAIAEEMWGRIESGEDFWSVVHEAFRMRELTRADLAALIDRCRRSRGVRSGHTASLSRFRADVIVEFCVSGGFPAGSAVHNHTLARP
jgi:DNA-binding NtrC family response regulator